MADPNDGAAVIVLVVDDETLVRLVANDILTDAGYRVLEAHDGREALTILGAHGDVQALFTDVTMPNLDGLSLARIVAERWPRIGIVVTSAVASPAEVPKGSRFVRKPYTPRAVLEAIEAVIAETVHVQASAAPVALTNMVNLQAGRVHGAGGLAQPLQEPDE